MLQNVPPQGGPSYQSKYIETTFIMLRAKVMFFVLTTIGTVGTALAFKVSNKGVHTICYLTTFIQPPKGGCIDELTSGKAIKGGPTSFYYTRKTAPCNTLDCPYEASGWED